MSVRRSSAGGSRYGVVALVVALAVAVVSAVSCAVTGFETVAGGGATTTSQGGATSMGGGGSGGSGACSSERPPPPPTDATPGGTTEFVVAIRSVDFNEDLDLAEGPTVCYDLDKECTCGDGAPTCTPWWRRGPSGQQQMLWRHRRWTGWGRPRRWW